MRTALLKCSVAAAFLLAVGSPVWSADEVQKPRTILFVCGNTDTMGPRYAGVKALMGQSIDRLSSVDVAPDTFAFAFGLPAGEPSLGLESQRATAENRVSAKAQINLQTPKSDVDPRPLFNRVARLHPAVVYYLTDGTEWQSRPGEVQKILQPLLPTPGVAPLTRIEFVLVRGRDPFPTDLADEFRRVAKMTGGSVRDFNPRMRLFQSSPLDPVDQPRLPVPPADALAAAKKLVTEVYSTELANANKPDRQLAIAEKMTEAAVAEKSDVAGRYELFEQARQLAINAGDLEAADRVTEVQAGLFAVDAVKIKADAADAIAKALKSQAAAKAFVPQAIALAAEAAAMDDYDAAGRVDDMAVAAARLAHDPRSSADAKAHAALMAELKTEFADCKAAEAALAVNAADPKANLTVGRFRCLVKNEWDLGIPLLARSSDAKLAAAANAELKVTSDAATLSPVADLWWDAAESETGVNRAVMRSHAGDLYSASVRVLTGLTRAKAEKRISELVPAGTTAPNAQANDGINPLANPSLFSSKGKVVKIGDEYRIGPDDDSSIESAKPCPVPCKITAVVKTDSRNIRFGYDGSEWMIFDWKQKPDTLLMDDAATHQHQEFKKMGVIPPNHFAKIEITMMPKSVTVSVDGEVRATQTGDYGKLKGAVKIYPAVGSIITVKEFSVTKLGHGDCTAPV